MFTVRAEDIVEDNSHMGSLLVSGDNYLEMLENLEALGLLTVVALEDGWVVFRSVPPNRWVASVTTKKLIHLNHTMVTYENTRQV